MCALRLDVRKTYKLYIGGNFVRSESGRSLPAQSPSGELLDNFCHASRKDLRDAVAAARPAAEGWAKKSAYLRGQILYRAAEMLEDRAAAMTEEIARSTGAAGYHARVGERERGAGGNAGRAGAAFTGAPLARSAPDSAGAA